MSQNILSCFKWRQPLMEDDLKILKVEYPIIRSWFKDHNTILNLGFDDQTKRKMTSNGRRPPIEDNLQWKTTSNGRRPQNIKSGISQHTQIVNLSLYDQTIFCKSFKWRQLQNIKITRRTTGSKGLYFLQVSQGFLITQKHWKPLITSEKHFEHLKTLKRN